MEANTSSHSPFYTPLPDRPSGSEAPRRRPLKGFAGIVAAVIFLLSLVAVIISQSQEPLPKKEAAVPNLASQNQNAAVPRSVPRGVAEGVSAKSNPTFLNDLSYNWTNAMFSWQRTAYHFQPEKNWMNDPDGPLFHRGWYHLFYQYNPDSAVWGNITWGHTVSRDLIHWLYLPFALVPDQWYDIGGVWTGSATILPNGQIIMLYTGDTYNSVQVQNLAYPANLSDPILLDWVKYSDNPVLTPPSGIYPNEYRDPSTGWTGPDGTWRIMIGSKVGTAGVALVYQTTDFKNYTLLDGFLHSVPGTGMWECVDFYPVATNGSVGLDNSDGGPGTKHLLKASLDDKKIDVYALGTYDPVADKWTPDNPEADVGIGLRVDYGKYYASKTFFDPVQKRRILWGWINETDTQGDDVEKGWASVQTIPRTVLFDNKTGTNIVQWPVEEVETLRLNSTVFDAVVVGPGEIVPLDVGSATQLDITAEFETEYLESNSTDDSSGCGAGAIDRSTYGPFGLLVIADESLSELTPVYFRPSNTTNGTYFCSDESRSSLAPDVTKAVYGGKVPVLDGEILSMRLLVDHSVVESFAQGGRTVVTSRIYPTEAIYGAARLFLFNNATGITVKATLTVWQLNSAFIHPFPLDQMEKYSSA